MGCGCNRNRAGSANLKNAAGSFTYSVTLPSGEVKGPYLTALEAKREIRRVGGGTITRNATPDESPAA